MNFDDVKHFIEEFHTPQEKMEVFVRSADLHITPEELEKMCAGNKKLESLYEQMVQKCFEYTEDVFRLEEIAKHTPVGSRDDEWKYNTETTDQSKHSLHEVTIDNINILSRNLKEAGKSNDWIGPIVSAGANTKERRARYGRFAIAFAFSYYLSLRRKEEQHNQS